MLRRSVYRIRRIALGILVALLVIAVTGCALNGSSSELPDTTEPGSEGAQKPLVPTPAPAMQQPKIDTPKEPTSAPDLKEVDARDPEEILAPYKNGYAVIDQASEDFELMDLEGNLVKLSDLKGKTVFLNFWATWCPPCRDEMPHMQTFYDRYKDQDVEILAVAPTSVENRGSGNSDKAERQVRSFIEEYGFTFPVLLDKEDEAWAIYQQRGIPANYVIDAKGIVRYLKPGSFLSVEEMEAFLEAVLATEAE